MEEKTQHSGMPNNVRRGLAHILLGLAISALTFYLPRPLVLFIIGLATFIVLLVDLLRFRIAFINRVFQAFFKSFLRDYESSRLLGASYLFVGSLFSLTVFSREVAVLAISFLAVGDALATIIGERIGKISLFKKNLEGILVCLAGCLIVGFIWRYTAIDLPVPVIITGAVGAAVAEGLPLPFDDNLTIPLLSGLVMTIIGLLFR